MASQKPVFKPYIQSQLQMLPPSLEDLIPKSHAVRVVNDVIDRVNIAPLVNAYQSRGTSSYHPQMLLKIVVYGYVSNVYSSRKLETACRENINFMWLSGMNNPDHNTINRFRGVRLKDTLRKVFEEVVLLLATEGLLSIEEVYTDGTKIEANANKYSFVWKKSIQSNKEKMKRQLLDIWQYAQQVASQEEDMPPPPDFTTINKEQVKQTIDKLNEVLADKAETDAKVKSKLRYISQTYEQRLDKYELQEKLLGDRNSYSKTDPDATFMRMKEDHMLNGQLKAGYNLQISTSNQYIVHYSIHSNPTDTCTLKSHLEQFEAGFGSSPEILTADAGYGSEENYELLQSKGITAYVKYGMFDKEQSSVYGNKQPFSQDKLFYNQQKDCYICPMGQPMNYIGQITRKTSTGFKQFYRRYQAINCVGCPLNGVCHKSSTKRIIDVNVNLQVYKQTAAELLNTQEGIKRRKQRCCEVEPVFGNIKQNHGFRRFMLRGKEKVAIECGLLAIAQNIRKKAA